MDLGADKKLSGLLVPVFSLRGENDLGIGDAGALREAITWAAANHIGAIQILPINEPGGDHSPYNLLSAMALDPLTVETRPGTLPGLLKADFERVCRDHPVSVEGPVHYPAVAARKEALFDVAFRRFVSRRGRQMAAFEEFTHKTRFWLDDYSTFRALVDWHGGSEVTDNWPAEHRSPSGAAGWLDGLEGAEREKFEELRLKRQFIQWVAHTQWQGLRDHADDLGVALIGDVPVGVSRYSADVWKDPELFDLHRASGAPPEKVFRSDPFTERWGQNWGFPLYDWEAMSRNNFLWWRRRLRSLLSLFHLLRVDHALGFFRIYSFPWRPEENERFTHLSAEEAAALTGGHLPCFIDRDDSTEDNREHNRRRGELVFRVFSEETESFRLLAEDLGEVAPYVRPTLKALQIPGFKIPQWERTGAGLTPGSDYERLSLATFGTHDHPPIRVFWDDLYAQATSGDPARAAAALQAMTELLTFCQTPDVPLPQPFNRTIHHAFLKGLLLCNSWLAIHMITDLFGGTARLNVPGSAGDQNWTYRVPEPIAEWSEQYADVLNFFREAIQASGRQP